MFWQFHLQVMNVKLRTVNLFLSFLDSRGYNLVRQEKDMFFQRDWLVQWQIMCYFPRLPLKWISQCFKWKISSVNILFAMMLGGQLFGRVVICLQIIIACSATYLARRGTVTLPLGVPRGRQWTDGNGDEKGALRNTLREVHRDLQTVMFPWMQAFMEVFTKR